MHLSDLRFENGYRKISRSYILLMGLARISFLGSVLDEHQAKRDVSRNSYFEKRKIEYIIQLLHTQSFLIQLWVFRNSCILIKSL